jgi:hypothetical protein
MGQAPTHPTEAMMIIQALQPTGHAKGGSLEFTAHPA